MRYQTVIKSNIHNVWFIFSIRIIIYNFNKWGPNESMNMRCFVAQVTHFNISKRKQQANN